MIHHAGSGLTEHLTVEWRLPADRQSAAQSSFQ